MLFFYYAHRFLFLKVAPLVEQFVFPKNLTRGKRLRVICTVTEGDLPIDVQWRFNGVPFLGSSGAAGNVRVRRIDEYTSLLAISNLETDHAGNYSCAAKNTVSEFVRSAVLTIRGIFVHLLSIRTAVLFTTSLQLWY